MDEGENSSLPDSARPRPSSPHFRLHEHGSSGLFVNPDDNTWAAYAHFIKNSEGELGFDAEHFRYFDGIIASKLGKRALHDPKHADYGRFEAMRNNIAVLRNYILSSYEQRGMFADKSLCIKDRVESIAESLGQALANDKWNTRAFTRFASVDVANIDGVGAMEMYKHLLDIQEVPTTRQPLISNLKNFLALPDRDWELPPLNESPFSPEALAAPPPGYISPTPLPPKPESNDTNDSDAQLRDLQNQPRRVETMDFMSPEALAGAHDDLSDSIDKCEKIVETVSKLQSVSSMAEAPREESVEEARKILRALRNMEFTDRSIEEFLDQGAPQVVASKKQSFTRLVDIFATHLKKAQNSNPVLAKHPAIKQAIDTAATIALEMAEHTRKQLREEDEREERMNRLIDSLPKEADLRITQSVERILETLELGLELASGREVTTSALERLTQAGMVLEEQAQLLQYHTTAEAAREESIAHARAALAHIQQLPLSKHSLQDIIDHGSAQEKAVFAHAIQELATMYQNLVLEAQEQNAEIFLDPKLKESSDAMSGFGHAIKLMAAKEMPNSIASAQQISAEAAREPAKWKDMHHHTVDRLIKSAEAGLERALEEIAMEAEEQDEGAAQELIESNLQQTDTSKRKKRRRGGESKPRNKKGGRKQRKAQMDMTADDVYQKQGRFAEDAKEIRRESSGSSRASRRSERNNKTQLAFEGEERAQNLSRANEIDTPANRNPNANPNPNRNNPQPNRNPSGRSSTRNAAPPVGLKDADLAAIAKLGGSLRTLGNQAQGLNVSGISSADKTLPDTRPKQPNDRENNPRGQSGPSK